MMSMSDYIVANLRFRVVGPASELFVTHLPGFKPFTVEADACVECDMVVESGCELSIDGVECKELTRFEFSESEAECVFLRSEEHYILTITNAEQQHIFTSKRDDSGCVRTNAGGANMNPSFVRFGVWFMLNIVAVQHSVAAVHSSVIVCHNEAVMFLGESGTGKSTHTRLWRENIEGATLLNDDSPFVGVQNGQVVAFGSPWSGKTPCYKNESYPIRAIVRLSQAPHNSMRRLRSLFSVGALLPSLPPAFAFDEKLEDAVMNVLSAVIGAVPVYHLECLPNAAAAQLSHDTIFGE
ncbi:MAG: hypothetical protein IJ378_05890 [Alistipes sp.]|nr:hypothetical protein [Alistipes sp.]